MKLLYLLDSVSWVLGSLIVIAIAIAFSISMILLVRRAIPASFFKTHHDVAGYVFANLGVLYSVLLGFTVLSVQQRFDKMKEYSQVEASYLSELYQDAEVFSEKRTIQEAIEQYANYLAFVEWKAMTEGDGSTSESNESLSNLWHAYFNISLADKKQEIWYAESINKLNRLKSARLNRHLGIEESLSPEMWTVLILLGMVISGFVCLFGFESLKLHLFMGASIAATIALILFLIYSLDTVYTGGIKVSPNALMKVLDAFH